MSGKMTPGILTGNIADKGIFFREDSVPRGMDCFRGPAKIFENFGQAACAVEAGEIIPGTAIAVFPEDGSPGDPEALEKAVKDRGLGGKICLITDSDPGLDNESCTVFFYGSRDERTGSRAFLLADGDVVEYDLKKGILNADI
ncbi:MAG: dihydroxy-acid dehydratase, partial [Eubacterium sp.]|nr:dihydroxy-acid dehydratase [Eubacterium sp.]